MSDSETHSASNPGPAPHPIEGSGKLDTAPGVVAISRDELPPLPDAAMTDRRAGWIDVRSWFRAPDRPLEIEIGSGKGTFLVQQAVLEPERNFLGIEWAGEFFAHAADRVRRNGLPNVRMLHTDAGAFLAWRVPDKVCEVIHLYFPDPWPKSRHHKNRMIQDAFLAQAHRVLTDEGELRVVTDHADYWAWMEEHFARACGAGVRSPEGALVKFERRAFAPTDSAREGELVGSNFERKYRREGRPFHAAVLRKVP
ncbi:MAG: tRNA (guanosine(46)-N7)-methyltransferase TrmB [Planctomycetota bacterium]|nr:tRNA (guanosine(46)-N7)-methyltransferase TrmB [Planctomycetota bacterium]